MLPMIAFDESGNTGQNLLDEAQPIFTTAGVRFSADDVAGVRALLGWPEGEELHFVRMRKSRGGRERIAELLNSDFARPGHVKLMAIHKPFMVMTKMVDILIESKAYEDGIDLYERGGHLAMSNMFHVTIPSFCGWPVYLELLERFVAMMRSGRVRDIHRFYTHVKDLWEGAEDETFHLSLGPLLISRELIGDVMEVRSITDLDPAVPAFVSVASAWDLELDGEWTVVHDDSKPIAFDQEILECYMTDEVEARTFGSGDRVVRLPLRARGIEFRPSHEVPQIQIADCFASATTALLRGYHDQEQRDELWHVLEEAPLMKLFVGGMWPTNLVDPADLNMEDWDGSLAEFAGELIGRQMRTRHGPDWAKRRHTPPRR